MKLNEVLKTSKLILGKLEINGIKTLKDFFLNFPRTYEDRTQIKTLDKIIFDGTTQIIKGTITKNSTIRTPSGKKLIKIDIKDEIGNVCMANFINFSYFGRGMKENDELIVIGKPQLDKGKIVFWHPEICAVEDSGNKSLGTIHPVYSEINGVKTNWFSTKLHQNIDKVDIIFRENLPKSFMEQFDLMDIKTAIKTIHFPKNFEILQKAKMRIYFEKLLKIQLSSFLNKKNYIEGFSQNIDSTGPNREIIKDFLKKLSFELTNAQKKVVKNFIDDFYSGKPMLRLLQGDVGSGKTVCSIIAGFYIIKVFGGQVCLLAPTEVLAFQHFKNISKLFLPLGINCEVITGSTTQKTKQKIKLSLLNGTINFVVGTHALIQEDVDFKNLKFVIIDEQHKFGVKQRSFFKRFGSPHILQMSATPIPRSLALAYFGDFDISTIDELPLGRKKIVTKILDDQEFIKLKQWFLTKIGQGQKIFIVVPLIEESEKMEDVKSVKIEYEEIKNLFQEIGNYIGIMHGKIKPKEKDNIMLKFKRGEYKILVSTTVIEVGIDIQDATIMIIKNAERFGLSQLHQLRGRVGRSDLQSYCFLMTKPGTYFKRLKIMEKEDNGFKLAEVDLQFRGAGEILGVKQSGISDIPMEILTNTSLIEKVQNSLDLLLNSSEFDLQEFMLDENSGSDIENIIV